MTTRADYNAEEWAKLVEAPLLASMRVASTQFVLTIAEAAANANREGGFIGIGGKPVSSHEQAALDEIRAVLNGRT